MDCAANTQVGTFGSLLFWPVPAPLAFRLPPCLTGLHPRSAFAGAWLVGLHPGARRRHWAFVFRRVCPPFSQIGPPQWWSARYYLSPGSANQVEADGVPVPVTAIPSFCRPLGFRSSFGYHSCDRFDVMAWILHWTLGFRCLSTWTVCQSDVLGEIPRHARYYLSPGLASQVEADGAHVPATAIPSFGRPLGFRSSFGCPSCDLFGATAWPLNRLLGFRPLSTWTACQSDVLDEIPRPAFFTVSWGVFATLFLDSGDWVAPALAFVLCSLLRLLVRPLHLHRHKTGRVGARFLSFGSYHAPAAFGKIAAPCMPLLRWTHTDQRSQISAFVDHCGTSSPCDRFWCWLSGQRHPAAATCPSRNDVSAGPRTHRVPEDLSAAFEEAAALEDDPQEPPREDNPGGWLRPAPLDEDGDEEVLVAARRPGPPPIPTPATFAVLVVDAILERVEVVLECPSTVAQAQQLVDEARDHTRSLLYPHLVEVVPQPRETWGTFLAVPAWCDNEALVVFDLTDLDGRFFAYSVPRVASRAQLFSIAGVDPSPNIMIYAFGHPAPLEDEELHVFMGGCIFFVPRWLPARIGYGLPWMLRTPQIWNQAAILPLPLDGRFLCCVLDGGHQCFEIRPTRGNYVRQDIPAEFGLNPAQVTYQVSHPEVDDAAIKGRTCWAVLGVTTEIWRTAQYGGASDGACSLALVDCRPLLQGWTSIVVERGLYSHSELADHLSVFTPPGWQVQIDGAPVENGDLQLDPGRVLQAQFVPLTTDEEMSDGTEGRPDTDSESDADSSDSSDTSPRRDGSDMEGSRRGRTNSRGHSDGGSPQSRSRSPLGMLHAAACAVHCIGGCGEIMWCKRLLQHVCPPDNVWITSVLLCLFGVIDSTCFGCGLSPWSQIVIGLAWWFGAATVTAQSASGLLRRKRRHQTACISRGRSEVIIVGVCILFCAQFAGVTAVHIRPCPEEDGATALSSYRSLLTSDRVTNKDAVGSTAGGAPATVLRDPVRRPLPTPCRGAYMLSVDVGPTLLEECRKQEGDRVYLEAVAVLETLFEHFASDSPIMQQFSPPARRQALSLAQAVPITPFQQEALNLQELLPGRPKEAGSQDWLDNDLAPLLMDPSVPQHKRAQFRSISCWHHEREDVCPQALLIYSDGSAAGDAEAASSCMSPGSWAFSVWVLADKEYLVGFASSLRAQPHEAWHVGESDDMAITCEILGIVWGLIWAWEFAADYGIPVHCKYDCMSAGLGTFGMQAAVKGSDTGQPTPLALFACLVRQCVATRLPLHHGHVRAHSGQVANELCDELAKRVRRVGHAGCFTLLPEWPKKLFEHPCRDWAWLSSSGATDMPTLFVFEAEAHRLQGVPHAGMHAPSMGYTPPIPSQEATSYLLKFMTCNVLTLLDPGRRVGPTPTEEGRGMAIVAKREVVKTQLLERGILFAGFQETRIRQTATLPDQHFVMLHSAANDKGHYGVALWANKQIPYATSSGKDLFLEARHCTVTAFAPRYMIVQVSAPLLCLTILVAHGPSDLTNDGCADDFWAECGRSLGRRPSHSELIVLADANARVGSVPSDQVGVHDPEFENHSGRAFHQFIADNGLWLPATFPECHAGRSTTWTSPSGQESSRIDYVGVPIAWVAECVQTAVWEDFEGLQTRDDHWPATLCATLCRRARGDAHGVYRRKAVRPGGLPSDHYVPRMESLLRSPALGWNVGVDEHFGSLVQGWQRVGKLECTSHGQQPQQSYLRPATFQLISWRKAWRAHLRQVLTYVRNRRLAFGFTVWKWAAAGRCLQLHEATRLRRWALAFEAEVAQAACAIARLGPVIKQACKEDRVAYLRGLVEQVSLADLKNPKHLYRCVKKAFPKARSARRSLFCPIPAVISADGDFACDTDARLEAWRSHFSAQEEGNKVTDEEYCAQFREQRAADELTRKVFDLRCLPTLVNIEQTIVQLPRARAAGYDGLTGELFRLHVPTAARALLAVYTKASMALYEPVEFRGGALLPLAKKASAALACDRFRSILLSNVAGKVYHKQIRNMLVEPFRAVKGEMQAGALPGISTEAVAMVVRTFREIAEARKLGWAITFFDVRAAFYRVIRQTLTHVGEAEWAFRKLLHGLGVPPEALGELADKLRAMSVVPEAGASEHLCVILSDALQGTWFRLDQGFVTTYTRKGTRPGDCLADILFAFSYSAYSRAADQALRHAGLATATPTVTSAPPWDQDETPEVLGCCSWADDFAHMTEDEDKAQVPYKVQQTVRIFVEQADSIGMDLTFASDKTAAMIGGGPDFPDPVKKDADGAYIEVASGVTRRSHRLPLVPAYRHLGGIVTATGTPAPEVAYRHALALSVARPLRSKLFGEVGIPLQIRKQLLRSLVISRFVFGSAAVPLHVAFHARTWARHYIALWRLLWKRRPQEPCIHCYEVLRQSQSPTPPLALAMARAVFLRQVLGGGPSTLLTLLHVHWRIDPARSWLGALVKDVEHVAMYVPTAATLLQVACPLTALVEVCQDKPRWWIAQVKLAHQAVQKDLQAWADERSRSRGVDGPQGPVDDAHVEASPTEEFPFACSWCGKAFRLRKHLGVHLARSHCVLAPARHLAHTHTHVLHACDAITRYRGCRRISSGAMSV